MDTDTREVRAMLESHDPLPDEAPAVDRDSLLRAIVSTPHDDRPADPGTRSPRRRLALGAGVAVVACIALIAALVVVVRPSGPAYAATPAPLELSRHGKPAAKQLRHLARLADRRPVSHGRYGYAKTIHWWLSTAVEDGKGRSVIVPGVSADWTAPDGSARECDIDGKPVDPNAGTAADQTRRSARETPRSCHTHGHGWSGPQPRHLPTNPQRLKAALGNGDGRPAAVFLNNLDDDLTGQAQTPAFTATTLRAFATFPAVVSRGTVRDRLGRPAVAFTIDEPGNRLRDVLLVSPRTGTITGTEEIALGHGPDKAMGIRLPAVVSYDALVAQGFVDSQYARPA